MTTSPRSVQQVPRFRKAKRRLHPFVQDAVDAQVRKLVKNPLLGEPKVGALKGVRVFKFKKDPHQYLLTYRFFSKSNVLEMLDIGLHENFYRDLERYVEGR